MERQIYDLETDYLTGTEWGNALVGWAPLEEAASIVRRPTARGRAPLPPPSAVTSHSSRSSSNGGAELGLLMVRRQFSLSSVGSPATIMADRVAKDKATGGASLSKGKNKRGAGGGEGSSSSSSSSSRGSGSRGSGSRRERDSASSKRKRRS